MAEAAQRRVQDAVNNVMTDIDQNVLRKLQGDMHRCGAKCCDDTTLSMEGVQRCMDQCSGKLTKAQKTIESEMTNFQDRLSRCVQGCSDKIRDMVSPDTKESEMSRFQGIFEQCVVKCADDHVEMLPKIGEKLKESIKQINS